MEELLNVVNSNGYTKHFYGYKKVTKKNTHWITLFTESIQMYGYANKDSDMEKIYDTGMIKVDSNQLQNFIDVWILNYN